jgi:hypothetical protein
LVGRKQQKQGDLKFGKGSEKVERNSGESREPLFEMKYGS